MFKSSWLLHFQLVKLIAGGQFRLKHLLNAGTFNLTNTLIFQRSSSMKNATEWEGRRKISKCWRKTIPSDRLNPNTLRAEALQQLGCFCALGWKISAQQQQRTSTTLNQPRLQMLPDGSKCSHHQISSITADGTRGGLAWQGNHLLANVLALRHPSEGVFALLQSKG